LRNTSHHCAHYVEQANTTQNTFSIAYIYQQPWRSRICGTTHVRLKGCLKRGGGNWNPSYHNRRWRDEPVPDSSRGRKKKRNEWNNLSEDVVSWYYICNTVNAFKIS